MTCKFWMVLICVVPLVIGAAGCGDDDGASGDCPQLSGTWKITSHCNSSTVGSTMTFDQSGCVINQLQPWTGWSGSIDKQGNMVWSGPAGAETMVCNAKLNGSVINASCTPACAVTASRQ